MADDPNDNKPDPNADPDNNDPSKDNPDDVDDLETWKRNARKWEREAKASRDKASEADELRKQLAEIQDANKSERERELDKVRQEAAEKARSEANTQANRRILKSEVRAAAAGKLADPEDAVRFLDLDEFKVTDDGEVETKQLNDAITRLLKDKPYLSADAGKRKHGDVDQGARGGKGGGTSMNDLIRAKAGRGA